MILNSLEYTLTATDLIISGRGIDFEMTRTYRSQISYSGPAGQGWSFNHNRRLVVSLGMKIK